MKANKANITVGFAFLLCGTLLTGSSAFSQGAAPSQLVTSTNQTSQTERKPQTAEEKIAYEILTILDTKEQLLSSAKTLWETNASAEKLPTSKTWDGFRASIEDSCAQGLERISKVYVDTFSLEELKTVRDFLRTTAGRKFAVQTDEFEKRLTSATEQSVTEIQNSLQVYLNKKDTQ